MIEAVRAFAARWWFPVVAMAILILALVWGANMARNARRDLDGLREAYDLKAKGFNIAQAESKSALDAEIARRGDLEAEVARLKKAAPGTKPIGVGVATTGPLPVKPPAAGPAPVVYVHVPAPPATCFLAPGDTGEIRVSAAALRTPAGNVAVVGTAEAWRLTPEPSLRLLSGPLQIDVSIAQEAAPPGWGFGVAGVIAASQWAIGPAISPPPFSIFGHPIEAVGAFAFGPTGNAALTVTAFVR